MNTIAEKGSKTSTNTKIAESIGKMFSFNNSLKLFHWHITGQGSYARHMALDQALEDLIDTLDRIAETSLAMYGDLPISIPETKTPNDIVSHVKGFYDFMEDQRALYSEAFTQAIIDDYQEGVQQLLYRLKRLQ